MFVRKEKNIILHPLNLLEVNELLSYIIPFKGLSSGMHNYQFHVTDKFFEAMQASEIHPTNVHVDLELDYNAGLMTLYFKGQGEMIFPCDICLEDFAQPIEYKRTVIVKTGEEESDDDDIIFISPLENQLDISQIIYDDILLSLPIRKVHPEDEKGNSICNPEQIRLLKKLNDQKQVDHRWDALKGLKFED